MREIRMSGSVGRGLRPPYPIRRSGVRQPESRVRQPYWSTDRFYGRVAPLPPEGEGLGEGGRRGDDVTAP